MAHTRRNAAAWHGGRGRSSDKNPIWTIDQRGGVSGDGVAPLPGCIPGDGTSGEAAWGATAGAGAGSG